MSDILYMRTAIGLARRGLGATWPNPSVGCVITNQGCVVGRGRTGVRGRPHAETEALAMAGAQARGGTAYVTLEPCSHHGATPPCAEALVAAGISRVVVACGDPDKRVDGRGLAMLRAAGVAVELGLLADEAAETLAGFFSRVQRGRPLVTLKMASTLDGRSATAKGESRWITGAAARHAVHALRGQHDAVMVGSGTLLADDPDLTCRIAGYAHRPVVRIVADSRLRTPVSAGLVASAHHTPSWILYHSDSLPEGVKPEDAAPGEILPSRAQLLAEAGARCILVPAGDGGIDLAAGLKALGTRGLTRVLVEGGAQLAANLLRADLVDRVVWFAAPGFLGSEGMPAIGALGVDRLDQMARFVPSPAGPRACGADVMMEFVRA